MKKLITVCILLLTLEALFSDDESQGYLALDEFSFSYYSIESDSNYEISFDSDIAELIDKLGSPEVSEENLWGWQLKKYDWNGLNIFTLPKNDIIIVIIVKSDLYTLNSGISIHSNREEIISILGNPSYSSDKALEYYCSNRYETWGLSFEFINDYVSEIVLSRMD